MEVYASVSRGGDNHTLSLTFEGGGHEELKTLRIGRPRISADGLLSLRIKPDGDRIKHTPAKGAKRSYCHKGWAIDSQHHGRIPGAEFYPHFGKTKCDFVIDATEILVQLPKDLRRGTPVTAETPHANVIRARKPRVPTAAEQASFDASDYPTDKESLKWAKDVINFAIARDPLLKVHVSQPTGQIQLSRVEEY